MSAGVHDPCQTQGPHKVTECSIDDVLSMVKGTSMEGPVKTVYNYHTYDDRQQPESQVQHL